jgi:hypothetical protein
MSAEVSSLDRPPLFLTPRRCPETGVAPSDGRTRCTCPIHWTHERIVRPNPDVGSPFERCSTPTLTCFGILLEFPQLPQSIDTSELGDCLVLQTAQPLSCAWARSSGVSLLLLAPSTPSFLYASSTNTECNGRVESLREVSTVESKSCGRRKRRTPIQCNIPGTILWVP